MNWLVTLVIGAAVALMARARMPWIEPGETLVALLLGIAGAFVGASIGGFLTGALFTGFSWLSLVLAVAGSVWLMGIYASFLRRKVRA